MASTADPNPYHARCDTTFLEPEGVHSLAETALAKWPRDAVAAAPVGEHAVQKPGWNLCLVRDDDQVLFRRGVNELGDHVYIAAVGTYCLRDLRQVIESMFLICAHSFEHPVQDSAFLFMEDPVGKVRHLWPEACNHRVEPNWLDPTPDGVVIAVQTREMVGGHPHDELYAPRAVFLIEASRFGRVSASESLDQAFIEGFPLVKFGQRYETLTAQVIKVIREGGGFGCRIERNG